MTKGLPKTLAFQKQILHQMKIARGHLDKVISMTENDDYCIDIVHQSQAIQAALRKIDQRLLKNHLNTCTVHEIQKGNSKKVVDEIMQVITKS